MEAARLRLGWGLGWAAGQGQGNGWLAVSLRETDGRDARWERCRGRWVKFWASLLHSFETDLWSMGYPGAGSGQALSPQWPVALALLVADLVGKSGEASSRT